MRLDMALMSPDLDWLTTRSEKVAYLKAWTAPESSEHPVETKVQDGADLANQFPGTFPIGIDPTGQLLLLYLATVPWTDDFQTFLVGHTALLRVTPAWTLRLVFLQPLHRAYTDYATVVHEELESPLQADTLYDLKRYFFHRRRGTDLSTIPEQLRAFLDRCAQVFTGPRFALLYRRWLTEDDAALTAVSPLIPYICGVPNGIRTRVLALKGPRPGPLDDGDASGGRSRGRTIPHSNTASRWARGVVSTADNGGSGSSRKVG